MIGGLNRAGSALGGGGETRGAGRGGEGGKTGAPAGRSPSEGWGKGGELIPPGFRLPAEAPFFIKPDRLANFWLAGVNCPSLTGKWRHPNGREGHQRSRPRHDHSA